MNARPDISMEVIEGEGAVVSYTTTHKARVAKNKEFFYDSENLLKEIEENFGVNNSFAGRFNLFWNALEAAHGGNFWVEKNKDNSKKHSYNQAYLFCSTCNSLNVLSAEKDSAQFQTANGMISAKNGTIQFVPSMKQQKNGKMKPNELTYEDAFSAVMIASVGAKHPRKIELIGGPASERALYLKAIKAFNASVAPEMRFELPFSLKLKPTPFSTAGSKFGAYMAKAKPDTLTTTESGKNASPKDTPEDDTKANLIKKTAPAQSALKTMDKEEAEQKLRQWDEFFATDTGKSAFKRAPVEAKSSPDPRNVHVVDAPYDSSEKGYVIKHNNALKVIRIENADSVWRHEKFFMLGDLDHEKNAIHQLGAQPSQPTNSTPVDKTNPVNREVVQTEQPHRSREYTILMNQVRKHLEADASGIKWEDKHLHQYWEYLSPESKNHIISEISAAFGAATAKKTRDASPAHRTNDADTFKPGGMA